MYADGIRTDNIKHTIADFNMQRKLNPGLGQAVGHIALSWSPNDEDKLSDEVMTGIALEYLQKMKIDNTQVLLVRHQDKVHPHVHIIYNRVNYEGKTISDNFQRQKSAKICKALTLKYGFYLAQDKKQVNRQQLKGADQVKYELHDKIKAVSKGVTTMEELKRELAKQGLGMLFKYKSGTTEVQGISFSEGKYKFKGSEIDRSLSYGKLSSQLVEQAQQKEALAQQHSLADQLREIVSREQSKVPSQGTPQLQPAFETPIPLPVIVPEPEEPNWRRKKKGQGEDESKSRGIRR
nr:relaxase/mobilization nuclease domain-containing protein [Mucilaginibacter robiniae]